MQELTQEGLITNDEINENPDLFKNAVALTSELFFELIQYVEKKVKKSLRALIYQNSKGMQLLMLQKADYEQYIKLPEL